MDSDMTVMEEDCHQMKDMLLEVARSKVVFEPEGSPTADALIAINCELLKQIRKFVGEVKCQT